ncbi:MAG: hypothetical protein QE263_06565 [Vampirovibrionales bacterium]|nr:hypothetical protein [Vampirovibrionales bacterium]
MHITTPPRSLFASVVVNGVKRENTLRTIGGANHTIETVVDAPDTLIFRHKRDFQEGEQAFANFVNENPLLADFAVVVDDIKKDKKD